MEIRINQVGRIISGDSLGHYVKVEDDSTSTGGYLVVTSTMPDFEICFDDWVQDIDSLRQYFKDSHWSVQWL